METAEKLTETEIISRILNGEKFLYEIIVRRFNPVLYRIGRSYRFHHEDTQDLMQETFTDAYKNLAQFEGRSGFKTWIVRIMMNHCYRKRNQSSYKNEIMQEIHERATPMFSHSGNDTFSIIRNREIGRMVEYALEQIPLDYRLVFSLRELNGLNVAETADLLSISTANVKVRLNRAKTLLRREIESQYSTNDIFEFNLQYCDAMVDRVMGALGGI